MANMWTGSISFGLVNVPVKLSPAARGEGISFNQLHSKCKGRIKQKLCCPTCEIDVERADLLKGFEVSKDKYVIVTDEEIKALAPESSKVMEITETVPADQVDPMLFESSYYFTPEIAGRKGYQLLHAALVAEKRYAIATATLGTKEHTVVIRPYRDVLVMHTMYLEDEVRAQPELEYDGKVSPAELKLARQLVAINAADFDHSQYADSYLPQVRNLIESKASGKTIEAPVAVKKRDAVLDITAALEASILKKSAGAAKAKRKAA